MYFLLQAIGRSVQALVLAAVTTLTDIGASIILVPHFGLPGAALSKVLVGIFGMIVSFYVGKDLLHNLDSYKFFAKGVVASLIPFAVVFTLSSELSFRIVTIIPYSLAGLLVFVACLKGLKVLNVEDRKFLGHVVPRVMQRLLSYI